MVAGAVGGSDSDELLSSLSACIGRGVRAAVRAGDLTARMGWILDGCQVCSGTGFSGSDSSESSSEMRMCFRFHDGSVVAGTD